MAKHRFHNKEEEEERSDKKTLKMKVELLGKEQKTTTLLNDIKNDTKLYWPIVS